MTGSSRRLGALRPSGPTARSTRDRRRGPTASRFKLARGSPCVRRGALIDNTAVPRLDADGTYVGHVGSGIEWTELVTSREALAEAARRKDDFLATLSHELRNPLAAILSASDIVGRPNAQVPDAIRWAAGVIERQAKSMAQLLNDLLVSPGSRAGCCRSSGRGARLAAVVEAALEVTRPAIENKRHALVVSLPPDRSRSFMSILCGSRRR